jgi:hypothetical protein
MQIRITLAKGLKTKGKNKRIFINRTLKVKNIKEYHSILKKYSNLNYEFLGGYVIN